MNLTIQLQWLKSGTAYRKAFKTTSAYELFQDYISRLSHYIRTEVSGNKLNLQNAWYETWICVPGRDAKMFTSEDLANAISNRQKNGIKELRIVIGNAEGFSEDEIKRLNPNLKWSFGLMTLPHELAAIVAAEQIYRAFTIQHKHPYHLKH